MKMGFEKSGGFESTDKIAETKSVLLEMAKKYIKGSASKETFQNDVTQLKTIIGTVGWPTISRVGFEASSAAWLIAQHADYDKEFQKDCLKLMENSAPNEVPPEYIEKLRLKLSSKK